MKAATIIPADSVKVQMEEPVLINQAPPKVNEWGPYRMPAIYRLPNGELCLTYSMSIDHYCDHGRTAPAFVSHDNGQSWEPSWQPYTWPHWAINGIVPIIMPVHGGEYYCVPARTGIKLDLSKMPKPVTSLSGYAGFKLFRLKDCPEDVVKWFTDLQAVRWSPETKQWTEENVQWDHRDQLIFSYDDKPQGISGDWSQKVFFEAPAVRSGSELLYADYWTIYGTKNGQIPRGWECSLMASTDNGRSWTRRSVMAMPAHANDNTVEPIIEMNQNNDVVGVLRTDMGTCVPMYLVHSKDKGYSWSEPQTLFDFGVFPRLLQMDNGVLVLSFGRPGVWLSFSLDGGHSWTQPRAIIEGDRNKSAQHSCGYTSLLALSKDTFLIAYSNFEFPNAKGEPCKTILVRRVTVTS
jgi:hypothetical protein